MCVMDSALNDLSYEGNKSIWPARRYLILILQSKLKIQKLHSSLNEIT